jgi:carbamoyltransferase
LARARADMYILGISALYHDSAAALLRDGVLIAAAQEERFTRVKFDHRMPIEAIRYCLGHAGISAKDLDFIAFYEKPLLKFERILLSQLSTFPRSWRVFREAMIAWFREKLWLKSLILNIVPIDPNRMLFVDHHFSHAASAMFCSPFAEAAVLTVDGVGEWTTTGLGRATGDWGNGQANAIDLVEEIRFPNSLGLLYSAFTGWLGFKVNSGEYKVMGMAAYGQPHHMDKLEKLIHVYEDGSFRLNMDYFSFHHSLTQTYNAKFIDLFGAPRRPESPFFTSLSHPEAPRHNSDVLANQHYADVAASVQRLTEDVLLKAAGHLHRTTGLRNLVMAGGVALNSVANGRIMREAPFEQVYIQPNAGDAGGALGAALYVWHVLLGNPRRFVMEHAFHGADYSDGQIRQDLEAAGLRYELVGDASRIVDRTVDALQRGEVVGFFQGRFEWGPRALGNRSILADPRRSDMKEIVNTKIKFREQFRPFAPVLPEAEANRYFDLQKADQQYPPRFMLMVAPALSGKSAQIPAVVHMGTGRLQTIRKEWNAPYYDVVRGFGEATGVPVLLNTSFNLRGEPLVATPANAINTFMNSGIDVLVMEQFVIRK